MVKSYKTSNIGATNKFKGKWLQFQKDDLIELNLMDYYWKRPDDVDLDKLYNTLIEFMKKDKYEFFENIEAKCILEFGKIKEVWINYWHIN